MDCSYLDKLNPHQRRAVEYGVGAGLTPGPLLIIAGAGSGKTNTLAHRVAHLVVNGVHPGRVLLLTFTRRAASEMTSTASSGSWQMPSARKPPALVPSLGLLREYAQLIGLDFLPPSLAQSVASADKRRLEPPPL